MASKIKIPYARRNGQLVHISNISSGLHRDCLCVACHQPLVARRPTSGRADHFAHHASTNCNAETALHLLAKEILGSRIRTSITENIDIPLTWRCPHCETDHDGNLLKRARRLEIEHDLGGRTPDLALFDENDLPCAVIEIVVTHEPDPGAYHFYQERHVPVVEFHIADGHALEALANGPLRATFVSFCPVPEWQRRIVVLAGTVLALKEVEIGITGSRLSFQTKGDDGTGGHFVFDSPEHAERALHALKDGSLDGLYEPGWLEGVVYPSEVAAARRSFATLGLREYSWGFAGIGRVNWNRDRPRVRRRSGYPRH